MTDGAVRTYRTPGAFRVALDARMKREAERTGRPLQRVIQIYLMQRFLARVLSEFAGGVTVKGGMALELRLERARMTNDIDVRMTVDRVQVGERLRRIGAVTSDVDYLTFVVDENPGDGEIDGDGVVYEGFRFRAQAQFAAKRYGAAFGVDVAIGDPMTGKTDTVAGLDLLAFVGAPALMIPVYPIATHLAEKLHAYTLPRKHTNHRMKDLIDIALIADELTIDAATLRNALDTTFAFRASHALPASLPFPPEPWATRYLKDQREQALPWPTLELVHAAAATFIDPVLDRSAGGNWNPAAQGWR